MPGRPKFTQTVSVSVEVSPVITTIRDWNRGFEKGDLSEWTADDAEINADEFYAGEYSCRLTESSASITQTLDDPLPVTALFEFSCWFKRKAAGDAWTLRMIHTDGTTNDMSGSLTKNGWLREYFPRSEMSSAKMLAGIAIISYAGDFYVDSVQLSLAGEIVTGAVDVSQAIPENLQAEAIARPKGGVLEADSATTTATYATVVDYTPLDDWKIMLAKILVSCPEDVMVQLLWNDNAIGAEVYVTGGIPYTDWYPWEYKHMRGDGSKKLEIQVKYPSGGAAATCHAEIVGEVVPWAFNY